MSSALPLRSNIYVNVLHRALGIGVVYDQDLSSKLFGMEVQN